MSDSNEFYGKYRGIVIAPPDPETNGKLTALVTLGGTPLTMVAEACVPYAGIQGGFYAIPTVGAGVWIEFEEGDIDRPIWSGCWWPTGKVLTSFGIGVPFPTQPVVLQSILGSRIILGNEPTALVTLETKAGALGPRIVMSAEGIKISYGPTSTIELGPAGVSINGKALVILPGS